MISDSILFCISLQTVAHSLRTTLLSKDELMFLHYITSFFDPVAKILPSQLGL